MVMSLSAAGTTGMVRSALRAAAVVIGMVMSLFPEGAGKPGVPWDMGGRTPVGPPPSGGIVYEGRPFPITGGGGNTGLGPGGAGTGLGPGPGGTGDGPGPGGTGLGAGIGGTGEGPGPGGIGLGG
ncbi:hypothetical protein Aoc01nite_29420 [Actinoplanes octamycinicus]|nr:hypothetical protein Aoc01nite_29420 [Actinoplanes octamycinicus]